METVLFCGSHDAAALKGEITNLWADGAQHSLTPPWLAIEVAQTKGSAPAVAFARQVLPDARLAAAPSVARWADLLVKNLAAIDDAAPWRMHILAPGARRAALIDDAVTAHLKKKGRSLLRRRVFGSEPFGDDEWFVQAALLTQTDGYVSICNPAVRRRWRRTLSRFPAGIAPIIYDARPPARAYLKLAEALAHLGVRPTEGHTCVDLGSAPGSWAYVALAGGAEVIAVDRAPLREDLMAHPRLTFVKGDAFTYVPAQRQTWLLCDVIAYPERSVALLDAWLSKKLCTYYVVTLKFRGAVDLALVSELKTTLARHPTEFYLRQLQHNKNEVTIYGAA